MNKVSILLATNGYPGVLTLAKLFSIGYDPQDIIVVSDEPDELFSRFCDSKNITINKDFNFSYSILLSVGYGKLVPIEIINRASIAAINLHPAITQKYRGRWCSSWAIINNESHTGFTWHYMDEEFDTGDIVLQEYIDIEPNDTAHSLYYKIYNAAIINLRYILDYAGNPGIKQETRGMYYNKNIPFNGIVNPGWDIATVDRFKRAMHFPPLPEARYE